MSQLTRRQLAGVTFASILARAAEKRWNILWLSCEDTSPDFGCYGDKYAITPNVDKLASQGVRYTNAFSIYGVCAPSRSSIITGMYPATIGTHHMRSQGVPPDHVKCFTEYLRAAGYFCTNNVKTDYNFAPPVTAWDENSNQAHWKHRDPNQPFFAVFNNVVTHESQIWATDEQYQKNTARLKPDEFHDPAQAPVPPYYPDTPTVRNDIKRVYDNITAMDYWVGDHLKALEEAGLADSTVVFFWGDHGRGMTRAKRWPYDSGTKVPLIVRWPGQIKPASVDDRLVTLMDLSATALSIAGVTVPSHMQAEAFLGPQARKPRPYVFNARDRMDETYDCIRGVRDKRFRYLRNYNPEKSWSQPIAYMDRMPTLQEMRRLHAEGKLTGAPALWFRPTKPKEELFDSLNDPHEIHDLAGDPKYAKELARLRAVHEKFMKDTGDLGLVPEPELKERMRPGGKMQRTAAPVVTGSGDRVTATCATKGSSIAYQLPGEKRWRLYVRAFPAREGTRFKACRLGYEDSEEVRY